MRRLPGPFDFGALPGVPRLPELPTRAQIMGVLRALTDVDPLLECLRGHREPPELVPRLSPTPDVIAKLLFDEWALQLESARSRLRVPTTDFRRRLRNELNEALDLFEARGWILHPRTYHQDPPPLSDEEMTINRMGVGPGAYEHARWESGWEPWPDEPGRERWLEYRRNQTAHAWLLRHNEGPRPWILCINGYRTGEPLVDLVTFRAAHLHRRLGLNVAILVQPLHGPRSAGSVSGDRVIYGGAMNMTHAVAQAAWDARRLLSWLRSDERAPAVGVQGLSLGSYVVGLLVALDADLACAIAGIPESDIVRNMRRTVEPLLPPFYEQWGLSWTPSERVARAVSPLAMAPLVPRNQRFIYAGLADRWVRPGNVITLWDHWERPEICWYQGSHLSAIVEPEVCSFVDDVLVRTLAR
jgi:hypothetical protein